MCLRISHKDYLREKMMPKSWEKSMEQTQDENDENSDVILESINGKGIITLNRPAALNACTLAMNKNITQGIRNWEDTQQFVIIKGTGKAFCSGGDIKEFIGPASTDAPFYPAGYMLTDLINSLRIPYIALMDGLTFGGGVGLSIYGSHRVATEKTVFAMPEVKIGFFPDVGSSYFFPRLWEGKGQFLGIFLALTGHRLTDSDVWHTGFATHMCHSSLLKSLENDLISIQSVSTASSNSLKIDIENILQKYHDLSSDLTSKPFRLQNYMEKINRVFSADSMEDVMMRLEEEARNCEWSSKILEELKETSPTSLKITWKLQRLGVGRSLRDCLVRECRAAQRVSKTHDFVEGITAKVIDKNRKPQWNPSTLDQVSESVVNKFFEPSSLGDPKFFSKL